MKDRGILLEQSYRESMEDASEDPDYQVEEDVCLGKNKPEFEFLLLKAIVSGNFERLSDKWDCSYAFSLTTKLTEIWLRI